MFKEEIFRTLSCLPSKRKTNGNGEFIVEIVGCRIEVPPLPGMIDPPVMYFYTIDKFGEFPYSRHPRIGRTLKRRFDKFRRGPTPIKYGPYTPLVPTPPKISVRNIDLCKCRPSNTLKM